MEGALKIRLTVQASRSAPYVRLANFKVTDASDFKLRLDDYQLEGVPLGHVLHFVAAQAPLHKMEPALNQALHSALTKNKDGSGWPVGGGIDRTMSVERKRAGLLRWVPVFPSVRQ